MLLSYAYSHDLSLIGGSKMEENFIAALIKCYFIALGVLVGGALIGGVGAFFVGEPPLTMISRMAGRLKIWALVAAIGGTFDAFDTFQRGIFDGATIDIVKQIILIVFAMGGTETGVAIIYWLTQEHAS